jgi:hypothetical protein
MRAFAGARGSLYVLYRSATETVHRDIYLLTSSDRAKSFRGEKVHEWNQPGCMMSTEALAEGPAGVLAAWETKGHVYFARIDPKTGKRSEPVAAPGPGEGRKHPAVAGNRRGETLLAWTEGMGWEKGGTLAWQVFDRDGKPTGEKGRRDGVPVWGLVAAFARHEGGFTVVY